MFAVVNPIVTTLRLAFAMVFLSLIARPAMAEPIAASLTVEGERFVLTLPDGKRLTSPDLVGAELQTQDGRAIRIDAVVPATERPGVLLHSLSVREGDGWKPLCDPDPRGRRAGFPVAGRWAGRSGYVKDEGKWFLTCTSGSQGKCILWGYDPWGHGPHGEDLAPFYQACQFTVRANYDGNGEAHTRNGTTIDVADVIGVATFDTLADRRFAFEAGWGPQGAVCVARTRWRALLSRAALLRSAPRLRGACDETAARQRGALILTRVMIHPVVTTPPHPAE